MLRIFILFIGFLGVTPPTLTLAQGKASLVSDFNGDGFDDLAIAIPGKTVDGKANAGAVAIITGGPQGLHHQLDHQYLHRGLPTVPGEPQASARWGSVLQTGDFNGDGFFDLAIAAPRSALNTGSVDVFFGSSNMLNGSQSLLGDTTSHVFLGSALASGDFNRDGFDDLAVGASGANAVAVFKGGATELELGFEGAGGIIRSGRSFGSALAGGDFNHDGYDDLAVGAPNFDRSNSGNVNEGRIELVYGTDRGLKPEILQTFSQESSLVIGVSEAGDKFGALLVSGDFDGNASSDIGISVIGESLIDNSIKSAGAVAVLYGFTGITTQENQLWSQASFDVPGVVEEGDRFGDQLAVGDFDGDGKMELVIGVPQERFGGKENAGVLHILRGTSSKLLGFGEVLIHHDISALENFVNGISDDDYFAAGLGVGDFNGDGRHDLAIGVPRKDFLGKTNVGAVFVLYGGQDGIEESTAQVWMLEDIVGANTRSQSGDHFGLSLSGGSADCAVFTLCASLNLMP